MRVRSIAVALCTIGAGALVVAGLLAVAPGQPAFADFASECSSPTQTVTGGSTALTLAPGDVVLIASGTFTGGVNSWPTGATVCVAAGATFAPSFVSTGGGRLLNQGTATFPPVVTTEGASIENGGLLTLTNPNNNQPVALLNLATGTVAVTSDVTLQAGAAITNHGTITVAGNADISAGAELTTDGTFTVGGNLTVTGTLRNTGAATITGAVDVNSSGVLVNACRLSSGNLANDNEVSNSGIIDVDGGQLINNSHYAQDTSGLAIGTNFANNDSVTGFGSYAFSGQTLTNQSFVGDSAATPIVFEDSSQTDSQIFDIQNGTVLNVVRAAVTIPPVDFRPAGCGPAATASPSSSSPSASITTSSAPPSTAPPSTAPPSTVPPPGTTAPSPAPPGTAPAGTLSPAAPGLPVTSGPRALPWALAGGLLIGLGLAMLATTHPRRRPADS